MESLSIRVGEQFYFPICGKLFIALHGGRDFYLWHGRGIPETHLLLFSLCSSFLYRSKFSERFARLKFMNVPQKESFIKIPETHLLLLSLRSSFLYRSKVQ
ncbi:hypothetical protein KP509_08G058700 [Ceratopteris richardii]|uniref:Uncharacterized protein n=1 Tax=Ceratopteris richardii TaxID=49495 RepID=A0A8T2UAU4_CERRI|nr:hypothetical protein KP509_08G058700 [Ceratopteris richardii]